VHAIRLDITTVRLTRVQPTRQSGCSDQSSCCAIPGVSQFGPIEQQPMTIGLADRRQPEGISTRSDVHARMIKRGTGGHSQHGSMSAFVALRIRSLLYDEYAVPRFLRVAAHRAQKYKHRRACCARLCNTTFTSPCCPGRRIRREGVLGADPEVFKRLKAVIEGIDPLEPRPIVLQPCGAAISADPAVSRVHSNARSLQ